MKPLDLPYARPMPQELPAMPASARRIILDVAQRHDLTAADLIGPSTRRRIHAARVEAIQAIRRLTRIDGRPFSYSQIGVWFGRDHTTIQHADKGRAG